jgi:hypothetical protein
VFDVIIQVNRKDDQGNGFWKPNVNHRVCSQHFVDGKPTAAHPVPELNLGYSHTVSTRRRPPKERSAHPLKKTKVDDFVDISHAEIAVQDVQAVCREPLADITFMHSYCNQVQAGETECCKKC